MSWPWFMERGNFRGPTSSRADPGLVPPNPRMQPTGRMRAALRMGGTLVSALRSEGSRGRRHESPAADAHFVRPHDKEMTIPEDSTLRDLANASGFVLQLGLEHQIRQTRADHGWDILSREHPWSSGSSSGFVDLIIGQGIVRLVIECKRPRDGAWLFLAPAGAPPTRRFRCQWAQGSRDKSDLVGWDEFLLAPDSPEADVCIIRGTGEKDRSLLERIVGGLIESFAPLALEELNTLAWVDGYNELLHVPVIVTTAKLYLCRYDPQDLHLEDGTLGSASFEPVPFVRFRKSLAHSQSPYASIVDIGAIARDKERSVLIVNPTELAPLLKVLDVKPRGGFQRAPWIAARELEDRRR